MRISNSKTIFLSASLVFIFINAIHANEADLNSKAIDTLKIAKPFDCNNLVNQVRMISRDHLDLEGYSVEQIENRIMLSETDYSIECKGIAKLSNVTSSNIEYKAFVDTEEDWIIEYYLY